MADIQRYLNLVISQHQNQPKFQAWLSAQLMPIDDIATLANVFNSSFDIDLAIGVQLDVVGQILGVQRLVNFQPTGGVSPILDDDTYRLVLKAKILKNQWDGTISQMYSLWSLIFKDAIFILQDNKNMTLNVLVLGMSSQIEKDLITNGYIIPRPEGVSMSFSYSSNPIFAYGIQNADFQGYGSGYWVQYL